VNTSSARSANRNQSITLNRQPPAALGEEKTNMINRRCGVEDMAKFPVSILKEVKRLVEVEAGSVYEAGAHALRNSSFRLSALIART
jgi:hypothetical protein